MHESDSSNSYLKNVPELRCYKDQTEAQSTEQDGNEFRNISSSCVTHAAAAKWFHEIFEHYRSQGIQTTRNSTVDEVRVLRGTLMIIYSGSP